MFEAAEQDKLEKVKAEILSQANALGEGLDKKRQEVLASRKEMWREAKRAVRDFDDVADLHLYAEEVSTQERSYGETSKLLYKLKRMMNEPYFARIDFTEEGEAGVEEIYIGRYSLFDEAAQDFLVYDWRAPISSLYYDYGVGPASFTVPATGAKIEGVISLKRQYQMEKGELLYLFDTDIAIDDEILRRELSKATDAHIKTIVNTIQAEQNQAIRAAAHNVLVYGPAGSGKTSVGLHRLAYLLYRDKGKLSSSKLRIFSPSPVFASYIAGIIPELGEDDVQNLDFGTLVKKNAKDRRPFHNMYHQIEDMAINPIRKGWVAHKYSQGFLDQLEAYVAAYTPSLENVEFSTHVLCSREKLEELYQDRTTTSTLQSKTARVVSYLDRVYEEYFNTNQRAIRELFNSIHQEDFSDHEVRMKFEEEKAFVMRDLKSRLSPRASKLYEKFMRKHPELKGASQALKMEKLYYEDAIIMLYIDILTGRVQPDKTVKHILIDEAQDLSPVHHRILAKLYTASHFTVLADANQALYSGINLDTTEALKAMYPNATPIPLSKSYRSTFEINSFAEQFLPAGNPGASYTRHGKAPEIIPTSSPCDTIVDILQKLPESYKTVGILLPTTAHARALHSDLAKIFPATNPVGPLQLIAKEENDFAPGVMVMAVPFAKGLEFDAVICPGYGTNAFEGELGRRLMYLICTRALHELYLLEEETK